MSRSAQLTWLVLTYAGFAGVQLGALPVARAQGGGAGQTQPYTVVVGDSCRVLARRIGPGGLARLHALNPQLGPRPHHLSPGTVLTMPRPRPAANLSAVRRRVERRAPTAPGFSEARRGQALPRGTQVRTHDAASAEITFSDDSQLTVRERTLLIVTGGRERVQQRRVTRAELERGALRSRLGELAGRRPLEVDTPTGHARLDGDAVIAVEDDGTSRVSNHGRRAATVSAGGARVRLPAGTGTVLRRGARPTAPRRLLAAPRWRADTTGPVVGFASSGATLRGGFESVEGAASYRVELAADPEGGELLTALSLPGDARRFEAEGLEEGTVYVSVASIDEAGLEGRRSPWRAFSVRLARLVAPGGVDIAFADDGPRVWPGTWLVAPRGMECGEDGARSAIHTFQQSGAMLPTCADRAGNVTAPLPLLVIAASPQLEGALTPGEPSRLPLTLARPDAPPPPPVTVEVAPPHEARVVGDFVEVTTAPDASGSVAFRFYVTAGTDRTLLGSVDVPVRAAPAGDEPEGPAAPAVRATPRPVASALGDLPWPSAMSLRDIRAGGVGAFVSFGAVEGGGLEPVQLRAAVGARAELPNAPVRFAFGSQVDAFGASTVVDRRGSADFIGSVGARLVDEDLGALALDMSGWFGTRGEPESLARVRLAPSVEAQLTPLPELALRTRQGALVDAREGPGSAALWAWAIGADVSPLDWIAFGIELDGAIGDFADRSGAALGLGANIEARHGMLEVAAGVRVSLTDEASALWGDVVGVLTVRVASE